MEQKASYKESAPPSDAQPRGRRGRWLWRAGAAVALASVLGLLYWGGFEQVPRRHPFHAPDLAGWFLGRMPHPGHGQMPMVPAGGAGGLAPRGLCAPPADGCGGLEIAADGRALLRLERTVEALARVRHMRETGHLFGVSAKGEVWQLTHGSRPAWRRAELPATAAAEYGKPGRFWQPQVLATLRGHGGPVWSAAFSPDGTRVVTASDDHVARLWDPATGAPLAILKGHDGPVTAAAFSPDGARIVTASGDRTARLWDAASGAALVTLEGHGAAVWSAAFSPDGMRIVTGSIDGMARLWDAATGATSVILEGHGDGIRSVAFSPDGTRVVTASDDGTARLWDAATGTTLFSLAGHRHQVLQAAFSPDGTRIVTASTDGTARLWDAATGTRLTATLEGGGGEMTSAALSPDGTFLLAAFSDGTLRVWHVGQDSPFAQFAAHGIAARAVAFSPDATRIVTASGDGTASLWSLTSQRTVLTDLAADGAETLWIVGRNGFVGQIGEGAAPPVDAGVEGDLLGVASLAQGRAVAVGSDGLLVRLERAEGAAAPAQQQQAQQQLVTPAAEALISPAVTWIAAAGERDLRAVQFLDEERGWIAGDDGLLLHTTDGGETWQALHDGGGYRLSDVHVQANGLGWAVGEAPDGRQVVLAARNAADPLSWAELPHHVGPWWFLVGVPVFILAGFMNVWAWRLEPPPPAASITGAATSDKPLSWRDPDARVLRPLARGLSRFLRNVNSEPPLTIAITGRWGSGKSSLMNLLQEDLRRYRARPVWFNAWHHREEEHLLAALFAAVRRHGPPGWWLDRGLAFRLRLLWTRSRTTAVHLGYLLLFAAIVALTVWLSLPGLDVQALLGRLATWLGGMTDLPKVERYGGAVLGTGAAALLALWLRAKMIALPANPAKLMAALARRASLGDFSDKLSFRDRFGEQFSEVCRALRTRRSPGLVILIDDLDRCQPEDTLKVLEAVNYFVSAGPCIVVLGMDRRQVEYCVGLGFEKLVEGLPDDELVYEDELANGVEGPARKAAKQRTFARHYLEKLINIEVAVPELTLEVLEAMLVPPEPQPRQVPGGDELTWWRRLTARLWRRTGAPLPVASEAAPAPRPHATEPPGWLEGVKFAIVTSGQVARVGVLAFVLGLLAVWGIEQAREWPEPEGDSPPAIAAEQTPVSAGQVSSADSTAEAGAPKATPPAQGLAPDLARVASPQRGLADKLPAGRRWVWWSPTVLALLIAALWGVGAFIRRDRQVVEDSADFRKALSAIRPLLEAVNPTPRAIKRYQNRMRYLAERLRPQEYEPGAIDVFLHWLGRRLGSSIVPDVWFQDGLRTAISEPALILLGAIETYAPQALEQPAEQVLAWLDRDELREPRTQRRREVWQEVKADFERRFADAPDAWPDAADVRLYQSFVRALGKEVSRSAPPSSPGSRAVRSKPRAVA